MSKLKPNLCCCKLAVLCSSIGSDCLLSSKAPISVKRKEADLSNNISRTVMPTSSVWRQAPSVASQILTVWSPDAEARCLLSREKTTELTPSLWPSSVWRQVPSVASQILTVWSPDADARCLPSCEKTTDLTQSLWPLSVWRQLLYWCSMVGRSCTYWGFSCLKCSLIKLRVGLNTTAEAYA